MPTECSADLFGFARVEGRAVVASFDGGTMRSDAGALLLGATDHAIGLVRRFASCFQDTRRADLIEHDVATLVGQRVFGIALGYEDLIDHDTLRHDPTMAVLAGKLEAKRPGSLTSQLCDITGVPDAWCVGIGKDNHLMPLQCRPIGLGGRVGTAHGCRNDEFRKPLLRGVDRLFALDHEDGGVRSGHQFGDPQHFGEPSGSVVWSDIGQIRRQANRAAAAVTARKVRPGAAPHVDAERSWVPIIAARIPRDVFDSPNGAARAPSSQQDRQTREGGGIDEIEIEPPLHFGAQITG